MRCSSSYVVYVHCSDLKQPLEFTKDDAELLFGPDADYKAAFEELDTDEDGEVRGDFKVGVPADTKYIHGGL